MQRFSKRIELIERSGLSGLVGRTALAVLIGCVALIGASSARADTVNEFITLVGGTNFFGGVHTDNIDFTDTFTFEIDGAVSANVSLITIGDGLDSANNIDFVGADLNGIELTLSPTGSLEYASLATTNFTGPLLLTVRGRSGAEGGVNASYSGTINVAIIPEPSTTLMMGLGLVGLGFAARRARA